MLGYTILSSCLGRETHLHTGLPVLHRMWLLKAKGCFYYVSWLSVTPEGTLPECMAFPCDGQGHVEEWGGLACSHSGNPNVALAEVLEQLLGDEAA